MKKYIIILFIIIFISFYFIPIPRKNINEIYPDSENIHSLLQIRKEQKQININGINWTYYIHKPENPRGSILFLHGMSGSFDIWWQQIEFFKDYTVISYTLPEEIDSLEKTKTGLLTILEKENIKKIVLIGTSMGGYITQYIIKKNPEIVEKAILSNTFPPNLLIEKENHNKALILKILPEIAFFFTFQSNIKNKIIPAGENSLLLKSFLLTLPITKKQFLNRYKIITDYFELQPRENQEIEIPKLIIESDNDPLVPIELRNLLKDYYKEAKVITLINKGHFPYVNDAKNYNYIIKNFIE